MRNDKIAKFPIPTLPGWRHYYDVYFYAGWRVQKNEVNGSYRVMSPTGKTWKKDNKNDCMKVIQDRKDRGLSPRNRHLVILVPGLNNVLSTFSSLEKGLKDRGYETLVWHFASNRTDTVGHAVRLAKLIDRLEDTDKISFVAHSMGGLIIRAVLAKHHEWYERLELGHIVNIASPHGGSFVADLVSEQPQFTGLFEWVCGHAGYDLTTKGAQDLPPIKVPIGIIIGGTGFKLGLNPLAGQDNDIVVSKDSAQIELAADFIQVKGSHTLMLWGKETVKQTVHFIENGVFSHNSENNETKEGR